MRIDDAILSGSIVGSSAVVSLSGSFTGSGHITLADTASLVISSSYALTASYTVTSSLSVSSSYAVTSSLSVSSSYAVTSSLSVSSSYALSSSYAVTASHVLGAVSKNYPTQTFSTDFNFTKDVYHIVDTIDVTGSLPSTPLNGNKVGLLNLGSSDPLIDGNGNNIMGLAQNLTVDSENASFQLLYSDATNGWIFVGANN